MNEQPSPTSLVRRTVRLERRQWDRIDTLAQRSGRTAPDTLRLAVDLGSDQLERDLNGNGGQQ